MLKIRTVMSKVQRIVEDRKLMDKFEEIRKSELDDLFKQRDIVFRAQQILEDHVLKKRVGQYNIDDDGIQQKENPKIGKLLVENLNEILKIHTIRVEEMSNNEIDWMKERLLVVLHAADIKDLLSIDETQSPDDQDTELLDKYSLFLNNNRGYI